MVKDDDVVRLGSRVRIRSTDGDTEYAFALVVPDEADVRMRRVSAGSPIGRALLGHRAGELVRFREPDGVQEVAIERVGNEGQ